MPTSAELFAQLTLLKAQDSSLHKTIEQIEKDAKAAAREEAQAECQGVALRALEKCPDGRPHTWHIANFEEQVDYEPGFGRFTATGIFAGRRHLSFNMICRRCAAKIEMSNAMAL